MIKRRIIATKLSITRQGEIKFFQVKIPFDAKVIIGIETAMRLKTGIQNFTDNYLVPNVTDVAFVPIPIASAGAAVVNPFVTGVPSPNLLGAFGVAIPRVVAGNSLVGELKLQSSDDSNVFYATNVSDPSVSEGLDKVPTINFITENVWTHGYKRELEEVLVDGNTTVLAGLYKDKLGEMLKFDVSYDVFLYVWYKFETKENDDQSCP